MQGILNKCHSPIKWLCKIIMCCTDKSKNVIKPTTLFLVNMLLILKAIDILQCNDDVFK